MTKRLSDEELQQLIRATDVAIERGDFVMNEDLQAFLLGASGKVTYALPESITKGSR